MKPQCETTPECLEQLARVIREFGFTEMRDALLSGYVKFNDMSVNTLYVEFNLPHLWSFAIAKLEDKPVFIDTENLYHKETGLVSSAKFIFDNKHYMSFNSFSWTPPKQTVSLKVGDNETVEVEKFKDIYSAGMTMGNITIIAHDTITAAEQFRKAMKPLVKE